MPRVYLTRVARQALGGLDLLRADSVIAAIDDLGAGRISGHSLRGRLRGLHSLPIGAYRLIYEQRNDGTLRVLAIKHRSSAYGADPRS